MRSISQNVFIQISTMVDINLFLCESMLLQSANRKLYTAFSDIDQFTECTLNEMHNQPALLNTGSSAEGVGMLGGDTDAMIIDPYKQLTFERFDGIENNVLGEKSEHTNESFERCTRVKTKTIEACCNEIGKHYSERCNNNENQRFGECKSQNKNTLLFTATTKHCPTGFCKILVHNLESNHTCTRSDRVLVMDDGECYLRRDMFVHGFKESYPELYKGIETGPALNLGDIYDFVPAIKCINWPSGSAAYFTRKRYWPKEKLLTRIFDMGIHVVGTAFSESEPECNIEFRLSFSLAEKVLIRDLSDVQFATYWFMKSIKTFMKYSTQHYGRRVPSGDDDSFVLKSYFLKTILLRKCEETKPSLWSKKNFLHNAKLCFVDLYHCYEKGRLENHFLQNCNLFASFSMAKLRRGLKEVGHIVFNWDTVLQYTFFTDQQISDSRSLTANFDHHSRPLTRKMSNVTISELMDDHKSPYRMDRLAVSLEAEAFSLFIFGADHLPHHDPFERTIEANLKSQSCVDSIIPVKKIRDTVNFLLHRRVLNIKLRHRRCRSTFDQCLETLEQSPNHQILVYPTSGFVDDKVSSEILIAYINFLAGRKIKALAALETISNFEMISPIGYISFWMNDFDMRMLKSEDEYLYNFLRKVLQPGNIHKSTFKLNCIILAHYIRSTLVTKIPDYEMLKMFARSIIRVLKDLFQVWRDTDTLPLYFKIVNQVLRNLVKKFCAGGSDGSADDFETSWRKIVGLTRKWISSGLEDCVDFEDESDGMVMNVNGD